MLIAHESLENRTAYATATLNTTIIPPSGASAAIFYWRISAVAGTTPIADCKLQYKDRTSAQFIDVDNGTFAQKTAASFQSLAISPLLTADTTGDFRATAALLPAELRAAFTFDRTTADETYTFTLAVDWLTG